MGSEKKARADAVELLQEDSIVIRRWFGPEVRISAPQLAAGFHQLEPLHNNAFMHLLDALMKLLEVAPTAYDDVKTIELRFLERP